MDSDSHSLNIRLLGSPSIVRNGMPLANIRRKNRALVYFLAAQPRSITREQLLVFFWPDRERTAAQRILRTMIHDLRKTLGPSFLADDQSLWLAPESTIDLQVFLKALQAAQSDSSFLAGALDCYQGDFLEGFSLPDSPQFEDWILAEREHYRLMAMRALADLAHYHESLGDFAGALEAIRRALKFDPLQEDLHRDALRLYYLNGDRAGVVRQYESLRNLLDEELGVPPMPDTRHLYDSLINDSFPIPQAKPVSRPTVLRSSTHQPFLPFTGRTGEIEVIKQNLLSGKLILIEGEPGIGKTRLALELIARQKRGQPSLLVLHGMAYELERGLPYQPVIEALRSYLAEAEPRSLFSQLNLSPIWLAELTRLLPELRLQFPQIPEPEQPTTEAHLWDSLLQFILALGRQRMVWLFLDDLHWADTATIRWLGYLIRHAASPALVVLGAARHTEENIHLTKLCQSLIREDRLARVSLSPLSRDDVQAIASALNSPLSDWVIHHADGNPFFLTELVRFSQKSGLLKPDGTVELDSFNATMMVPPTIQNLIAARLLRLSELARQILHLAAIIGREFDFALVQQSVLVDESETLQAFEELQAKRLIQPLPGGRFSFDHSLTMQVALQDMSDMRKRFLHRHVAEALETSHQSQIGPVSPLIAQHYLQSDLPSKAVHYLWRAGQFAAGLAAWSEAISFYEEALQHETETAQQAPIYLAMGTARFHSGDFAAATEDFYQAVRLAQDFANLSLLEEAHLALNQSLLPQARYQEAIAIARELRLSGPPELMLCAEFIWGTGLSVESARPSEAEYHLREAERLYHVQSGNPSHVNLAQIVYQLAGPVGQQGRSKEAIELYRQALDLLNQGKGPLDLLRNIMLYNNLAYHLHLVGDPSAADFIQAGIELARAKGSLSHLPFLYSTSGEIAMAQGDMAAAQRYFEEGLALAKQIPIPERVCGLTANLGLVARKRGDADLAQERLISALELAQQLGNHHLEVRTRIWLAPLLPSQERQACLAAAQKLAQENDLLGLLEKITQNE